MTLIPKAVHSEKAVRVMIVDDHPAMREGLEHRISSQHDMTVCGQAADIDEALKKVRELNPDVVIVDIALQKGDGVALIKLLKARHTGVGALVHSMYEESLYVDRCLRAGAMGYVNKQADPGEVIKAIREVAAGKVYLSPAMTSEFLGRAVSGTKPRVEPIDTLSDRELEVFRLIGAGESTAQIANRLHISVHTVDTHREHIKRKMHVSTVSELTRRAALWTMQKE